MTDDPNIRELLAQAGPALGPDWTTRRAEYRTLWPLLSRRNGFYAFAASLHVFPLGRPASAREMDIERWNSAGLWRGAYGPSIDGLIFFAEDVFGEQFAVDGVSVVRFNPETGDIQRYAAGLDEWAMRVLDGPDYETGFGLARQWERIHGTLEPGRRLLPETPFVLGGGFTIHNLFDGDAIEGMRFRADLAQQVRDVPDGAAVRLVIPER